MEVVEVEDTLAVAGMKEAVLVVGMAVVEGVIEVVVPWLKEYRT
jgi:hypothetical protein